jgi:Mg-chelatase subunit ChlD
MNAHKVFENSEIKFHTLNNKFDETTLSGFPNDILYGNGNFGILQLNMINKLPSNFSQTYAILFNVDCSASMSDKSLDGRTKMQHMTHTLTRILSIFTEMYKLYGTDIFVSVIAFDHNIHEIFDFTKITEENVDKLKELINGIEPLESTNIELALRKSSCICQAYKTENPTHYLNHILLTDGDTTVGERNQDILSSFVDNDYPNIFVGFGKQHNNALLSCLSNNPRGDYRFINNIENSGIVYGEIIQNILYNIIDVGRIVVKNGIIYNWKTNKWTSELLISNLASSGEKTFQITAPDMYDIEIEIYGCLCGETSRDEQLLDTVFFYPPLIDLDKEMNIPNSSGDLRSPTELSLCNVGGVNAPRPDAVDLTKYAFRQKTQELLYEANLLSTIYNSNDYDSKKMFDKNNDEYETVLNCKLKRFLKFIMNYMNKTDKTDKFLKLLCDDIYVTLHTLGNYDSSMWILNRQTSQGKQQTYKATPICSDFITPPILRRHTNAPLRVNPSVPFSMSQTMNLYSSLIEFNSTEESNNDDDNETMGGVNAPRPKMNYDNVLRELSHNANMLLTQIPLSNTVTAVSSLHSPSESISVDDLDDISFDNYELSDNIDTPYITDEIKCMMKNISDEK